APAPLRPSPRAGLGQSGRPARTGGARGQGRRPRGLPRRRRHHRLGLRPAGAVGGAGQAVSGRLCAIPSPFVGAMGFTNPRGASPLSSFPPCGGRKTSRKPLIENV